MKKLIICMMILVLSFCFVGCGDNSNEDTPSKIKVENTDSYDEYEEKEPLDLKENAKYVLVALKTKYIVINSEEDFANLKVAYLDDTDGEAYAKYYDFEEIGMYNAPNDLHSGIKGKDFDVGLIDEEKLSTYDDWEVVWEMKQ
ncbi:MAG: hypothetical protein IKB93_08410 [Clostridia bacterium]|nr:hypothetical protein [Clostridia bacterium]